MLASGTIFTWTENGEIFSSEYMNSRRARTWFENKIALDFDKMSDVFISNFENGKRFFHSQINKHRVDNKVYDFQTRQIIRDDY
jgi:hypothetical protein